MAQLKDMSSTRVGMIANLESIREKFELGTPELQMVYKDGAIPESAFLDASQISTNPIKVHSVVRSLFTDAGAISVTVVIPPDLPFETENSLIEQVVSAGGSAAVRTRDEQFDDVVQRRRELSLGVTFQKDEPERTSASSDVKDFTSKVLSHFDYSPEELKALRENYADEQDSQSVIS